MIRAQSLLKVMDNSGARSARCIKVKSKSGHSYASIGDIILVSVQSLRPSYGRRVKLKMNKSDIHHAVVIQTRAPFRDRFGVGLRMGDNAVALITPSSKPLGTRIFGVVPGGLRRSKWVKLAAMAKKIV